MILKIIASTLSVLALIIGIYIIYKIKKLEK